MEYKISINPLVAFSKGTESKKRRIIRDQKNHTDTVTTEHHLLKKEVGFELLWRCISKIWRTTQRWCMRDGLLKFEQ